MKQVLIISGPTGSGESTITNKIIKKYPIFIRLITSTTRKPRLKEIDKIDYYFFSKVEFENKMKQGNIVEYTYIKSRDVYYGTYKPDLDKKIKKGHIVIANTDAVGTKFYKKHYRATSIFINAESIDNIKSRLISRDPNISDEELEKRLKNAENEIKSEEKFYDYTVINKENKLEKTIDEIVKILIKEGYSLK